MPGIGLESSYIIRLEVKFRVTGVSICQKKVNGVFQRNMDCEKDMEYDHSKLNFVSWKIGKGGQAKIHKKIIATSSLKKTILTTIKTRILGSLQNVNLRFANQLL